MVMMMLLQSSSAQTLTRITSEGPRERQQLRYTRHECHHCSLENCQVIKLVWLRFEQPAGHVIMRNAASQASLCPLATRHNTPIKKATSLSMKFYNYQQQLPFTHSYTRKLSRIHMVHQLIYGYSSSMPHCIITSMRSISIPCATRYRRSVFETEGGFQIARHSLGGFSRCEYSPFQVFPTSLSWTTTHALGLLCLCA